MCFSNFISIRFRIFLLLHLWLPYSWTYTSSYIYNPFFPICLVPFQNGKKCRKRKTEKIFVYTRHSVKKAFFPFFTFMLASGGTFYNIFHLPLIFFSSAILNIFLFLSLPPSIYFHCSRISSMRYIYQDSIENVIVWRVEFKSNLCPSIALRRFKLSLPKSRMRATTMCTDGYHFDFLGYFMCRR